MLLLSFASCPCALTYPFDWLASAEVLRYERCPPLNRKDCLLFCFCWPRRRDIAEYKTVLLPVGMQMAAGPDATVEALATELARWDAEYHANTAAAGPAKWRLRQDFVAGTYANLLRSVQQRQAAAEHARAADADRRLREVCRCTATCWQPPCPQNVRSIVHNLFGGVPFGKPRFSSCGLGSELLVL